MTNTPFNAKGSFDLGRLNNISLLSSSSIDNYILSLKKDESGKYYLSPQAQLETEIQYLNDIVIGSGKSYFHKSTFFSTTTSNSYQTIKSYTIPIPKNSSNKKKLYLTLDIDLYGQSYFDSTNTTSQSSGQSVNVDSFASDFDYYNFTTGYNIVGSKSLLTSNMMSLTVTPTRCATCLPGQSEFTFNQVTKQWTRNCCATAGSGNGGGSGSGGSSGGGSVNVGSFVGPNYCIETTIDPSGTPFDNSICEYCNIVDPTDKYLCTADFRCIVDPAGTFTTLEECELTCVAPARYNCFNDPKQATPWFCGEATDGQYGSLQECLIACAPPTFYSCSGAPNYTCDPDEFGTLTLEQCTTVCQEPPPVKYSCSGSPNFTCIVDSAGIFTSIEQCQASCVAPLRYNCSGSPEFKCFVDSSGPFTTIEDCESTCIPPPPDRWTCAALPKENCLDNKHCVTAPSGEYETFADCMNSCIPQKKINTTSEIGIKNSHPVWSKNLNVDVNNLNYKFTHIPGSFTVLVDNTEIPVMFGSENIHQYHDDVVTRKQESLSTTNQYSNNILVLQPNYSTLQNPIKNNKVNIKDYPRVTSHINSNGDLVLTIEAKSLQYSNEMIKWFGKVELFVSIT